ncbi:ABC transporter [Opitutaceae bacterium TAV4]|uniref:GldG family protein n=1 Tax=Geminisphaera colitermitum TaxID=1148786 RepID=UPI0005B79A9B|nr:GldG family protein [Geminisphaera colitermitum]RRJ95228.1 ABC transporter [Opitutaceae bacterium TAV4]RRJ99486.1 ABC transporter [Opitutaceae bacterium TAV3]
MTFRTARWLRTTNLILQALLVLTLVSGLNYLALNHGWRFDLTQNRLHSLSPETRSYLKSLPAPVKIIITLTPDSENKEVVQAYRDVTHLLRDYAEVAATGDNPITVEYIDVYRQRRDAEAYGIDQPNTILVIGNSRRIIGLDELYQIGNREKQAFKGEQVFTAAILNVTSADKKRIYFLEGHGEMRLTDTDARRGLSLLKDELVARNHILTEYDLTKTPEIPDDAALVVIAGPQGRYSLAEQEILRRYLNNRAGRLLVLLAPSYPHGLEALFYDWGIHVNDVLIIDPSAAGQSDTGDLILAPATAAAEHPVTRYLSENRISLRFGPSRQVRPAFGATQDGTPQDPTLKVTPLLATTGHAWGERNYLNLQTAPRYDEGIDISGPLAVGTAAERATARSNLPFSIRGGRIVAYGGADWVANGRLAAGGNLSLILSSINWLIDRDTQLNIQPRPIQRYQLTLSQAQIARLRYALVFGLPALAALIGLIVYWTRRR